MSTKYPIIADLISGGEGGLNSVNRGRAGDTPGGAKVIFGKNLTDMTVGEILRAQAGGKRVRKVFAVGKFQFIPGTLKSAVNYTKVPLNAKFDLATQNRLFDYLIDVKRPRVGKYIRGEYNNRGEAVQSLAREFASVGLEYPEAGKQRGQSRYAGRGGNRASISPQKAAAALDAQRKAGPGSSAGYVPSYGGEEEGDIDEIRKELRQRASRDRDISKTDSNCNCGVFAGYRYEFNVIYDKTEQAKNPNTGQIRRDWLYLQLLGNITNAAKKDRMLIYLK